MSCGLEIRRGNRGYISQEGGGLWSMEQTPVVPGWTVTSPDRAVGVCWG